MPTAVWVQTHLLIALSENLPAVEYEVESRQIGQDRGRGSADGRDLVKLVVEAVIGVYTLREGRVVVEGPGKGEKIKMDAVPGVGRGGGKSCNVMYYYYYYYYR